MAKSKKTKKDEEEYILVDPDEIEEGVEYKLESWWDVFVRNYKNVPGFNALVKLLIYFFLFFILIVAIKATTGDQDSTKTKQQETTKVTVPYKEMVGNIVNYRKSTINIKINDTLYIINGDFGNNILTGTIESTNGLHNFKIKDNSIYEVKMGEDVLNNELLKDININIIMNN
ncbi:MAG: hypothetical protein K5666_02580 [Bacilli bacterium]|nr:hypothetical protein [Bacilli bacterium]